MLRRKGFTLLELVIVIAIIGILVCLLMPAIQHSRQSATRIGCLNNLRQIGLAMHLHHDAHRHLPPDAWSGDPGDPNKLLQWSALILPQIDQDPLWSMSVEACRIDANASHNPPHVGYITPLAIFACPNDRRLLSPLVMSDRTRGAFTSYLGIAGSPIGGIQIDQDTFQPLPGVLGERPGISFGEVTDGLSDTLMVGERPPPASGQAGLWYPAISYEGKFSGPDEAIRIPEWAIYPEEPCMPSGNGFGPGIIANPCDRFHFWSLHHGGGNFLLADGSARFFSYASAPILPALATRSGHEVVSVP